MTPKSTSITAPGADLRGERGNKVNLT